jgi:hypothetical protein
VITNNGGSGWRFAMGKVVLRSTGFEFFEDFFGFVDAFSGFVFVAASEAGSEQALSPIIDRITPATREPPVKF